MLKAGINVLNGELFATNNSYCNADQFSLDDLVNIDDIFWMVTSVFDNLTTFGDDHYRQLSCLEAAFSYSTTNSSELILTLNGIDNSVGQPFQKKITLASSKAFPNRLYIVGEEQTPFIVMKLNPDVMIFWREDNKVSPPKIQAFSIVHDFEELDLLCTTYILAPFFQNQVIEIGYSRDDCTA